MSSAELELVHFSLKFWGVCFVFAIVLIALGGIFECYLNSRDGGYHG